MGNGRKIVIWRHDPHRDPNILGGFGRYDPYQSRRDGDWKTGDTIYLEGMCVGKCALNILSTDHKNTNGGRYFNFDITALDTVLGRSDWHNEKLVIGNGRTVVVWRNPNGGSKGDGHGRYEPYSTTKDGDWAVGDKVTFVDCRTCTLNVLSTDHKNTNRGRYFNFDTTALDAILGRTTWHGEKLKVGNDKTVVVWRNPNGGSKGDGHGRYDPYSTTKDGDWAVGDQITFADCPNRLGLWRKGSAGATCDQTCNAIGHSCDAVIQSTIQSCADIDNAAREAGVTCAQSPNSCYGRTDRDRAYAGTPFMSAQSGYCYYLSGGARSVCDSNAGSNHEPLCYCAPKKFGLWRKGKAGATCDQTCNAIGRQCDSEMQSTIRSCEGIADAASKAGVSCAHHSSCYGRTDRDISYAGSPFISAQSGLCYFLSDGAQSVCNSNAVSHHEPLCYCV